MVYIVYNLSRIFTRLKTTFPLLQPGLGIKRWLIPLAIGLVLFGLGLGLFIRQLYVDTSYAPLWQLIFLQFWPRWLRGIVFILLGLTLVGYSFFNLNKTILEAFLPKQATLSDVARQFYHHRQRRRGGPKVVVIGGGTGLSVLLRGLKYHTENITAIVTVADDGGSSGKLRRELGVLPPGDFRNCIAALADDEALTTQLFQYRFRSGGLEGHSFGNLFITAMAELTGSFEEALYESGRVLNIRGTILPSTLENVTLFAEVDEGSYTRKVAGESAIPEAKLPIERVYFEPDTPHAFPPALQAILNADLIVAGPGSLYTSIIPNLLVTEIVSAIKASYAPKFYICNVATQPGETDNYTLNDHIQAIEAHTSFFDNLLDDSTTLPVNNKGYLFDFVLVNSNFNYTIPTSMNHLQAITPVPVNPDGYQIIGQDVIDELYPWRHDSTKLADQLIASYKQINKQHK